MTPPIQLSEFGDKFSGPSGIVQLMDDLGKAMSENPDMLMLGGGNPAHIPELQSIFLEQFEKLTQNSQQFNAVIGNYDTPLGDLDFRTKLADLLQREFGWKLTAKNVCLTHGSQSAFFTLFNMLAGPSQNQGTKRILFPLTPEYIGYADQGLSKDTFVSIPPKIQTIDEHTFKYTIDFDALVIDDSIAAICVSRPTNPTGNVLTDEEIDKLNDLANQHNIPLIIDNAYGLPFPDIIFEDVKPTWNENIILCMSLSKLGLPGLRTGILIANEDLIEKISNINSILSLAPSSLGATIASQLIDSQQLLQVSRNIIQPFYRHRCNLAIELLHQHLSGLDYALHKAEGALFLWVWFKNLPITSYELYERLKSKNVLIVSGHYFYPGLQDNTWQHCHECIRLTYSMDEQTIATAIQIIAAEVKSLYA